jgi:hypothetical protein
MNGIVNGKALAELAKGHPPYYAEKREYLDINEGGGTGPDGRSTPHAERARAVPSTTGFFTGIVSAICLPT